MNRRLFLQSGLFALPGVSPLVAGDLEKLNEATAILKNATDSGKVHAASLFVQRGETILAESFGAAAPSVGSIFLLASITKPICIAAAMALYDEGEFQLDDPASGTNAFAAWDDPDSAVLGTAPVASDGSLAWAIPVPSFLKSWFR